MIPILYEKTETAFTSNGIGRLSDAISVTVSEERNGSYELQMQYPVTGIHFEEITEGRIIAVTHDANGDIQPFDIYASDKPIDGIVTFYAHHISYRLNEATISAYMVFPPMPMTPAQLMQDAQLQASGSDISSFSFVTDIGSKVLVGYYVYEPTQFRTFLGGMDNSVLDNFGGEYEFDKFTVYLRANRGANNGVKIAYRKNLLDFTAGTDYSNAYTGAIAYWKGQDSNTNQETIVRTSVVNSGHTLPHGRTVIIPIDLSSEFNTAPSVASLTTAAQSYIAKQQGWLPSGTLDVDFVQLWDTEEYKDYAPLEKCVLCDTVNVSFGMYGLTDEAIKIVAVEWDALAERYNKITLGGIATSLTEAISAGLSGDIQAVGQTANTALNRVTDVTVNGSSVVTNGVAALTVPSTPESATVSASYSGSCNYLKFGRMVVFDGTIATSGSLANGAQLASGLPGNHTNGSMTFALNNNSTSENVGVYVNSSGNLLVRGSYSSASRSLRFSGAYIASS